LLMIEKRLASWASRLKLRLRSIDVARFCHT
jgi:hypothetical protein